MRILILLLVVAGSCSRSETRESADQATAPATKAGAKSTDQTAPEQPPAAPAGEEGQQTEEEPAPAVDLDAPPTVELLDPGKPPHKALRRTFKVGAKQKLRVESKWTIETVYGPLVQTKAVMPSMVYGVETEVREALDEHTWFDFRVTKVTTKPSKEVKPAQAKGIKKTAESLEGSTGSFSISARGIVEEFAIDAPPDASLLLNDMVDQIKQAIRLSSLPLPAEPVGNGGKWTATQVVEQRTAKIRHISTFELVGVEGEQIRATSTHAAETPKQTLKLPGSDSDAPLELHELDFFGDSKGTWRLNKLGPASASEHTLTGFKMTTTAPRVEAVVMALDTTLKVEATR